MTLLDSLLAQPLGEHVVHAHRRERNVERKLGVIPRHRRDVQILGYLDLHRSIGQSEDGDDLPDPVGSVVEGEDRVALLQSRFGAPTDDGFQELVRLPRRVPRFHRSERIGGLLTDPADEPVDGDLDPFPSLITVHSVVPPDDGRDLSDTVLLDEIE